MVVKQLKSKRRKIRFRKLAMSAPTNVETVFAVNSAVKKGGKNIQIKSSGDRFDDDDFLLIDTNSYMHPKFFSEIESR